MSVSPPSDHDLLENKNCTLFLFVFPSSHCPAECLAHIWCIISIWRIVKLIDPTGWTQRLPCGDSLFSLEGQKLRKDTIESNETLRTEGVVHELLGCVCPLVPGLVIVSCFQIHACPSPAAVFQAPWHCLLFLAGDWSLAGREKSGHFPFSLLWAEEGISGHG